MALHQQRCEAGDCPSKCLSPHVTVPLVVFACFIALIVPFFDSIGLPFKQKIVSSGIGITPETILIIAIFLLSVIIGMVRRHEELLLCVLDAIGLPGAYLAVYVIR
jgi:hypothetical protein